jgi:hypothetical protein
LEENTPVESIEQSFQNAEDTTVNTADPARQADINEPGEPHVEVSSTLGFNTAADEPQSLAGDSIRPTIETIPGTDGLRPFPQTYENKFSAEEWQARRAAFDFDDVLENDASQNRGPSNPPESAPSKFGPNELQQALLERSQFLQQPAETLTTGYVPLNQTTQPLHPSHPVYSGLPAAPVGAGEIPQQQGPHRQDSSATFPTQLFYEPDETDETVFDCILKVVNLKSLKSRPSGFGTGTHLDWRLVSPVFVRLASALDVHLLHGPGNPDPNIRFNLNSRDVASNPMNWDIKFLRQVLGLTYPQIAKLIEVTYKTGNEPVAPSLVSSRFIRNAERIAKLQRDINFNPRGWEDRPQSSQSERIVTQVIGGKRQRSIAEYDYAEPQRAKKVNLSSGEQQQARITANFQPVAPSPYANPGAVPSYHPPPSPVYVPGGQNYVPIAPTVSRQRVLQPSARNVKKRSRHEDKSHDGQRIKRQRIKRQKLGTASNKENIPPAPVPAPVPPNQAMQFSIEYDVASNKENIPPRLPLAPLPPNQATQYGIEDDIAIANAMNPRLVPFLQGITQEVNAVRGSNLPLNIIWKRILYLWFLQLQDPQ